MAHDQGTVFVVIFVVYIIHVYVAILSLNDNHHRNKFPQFPQIDKSYKITTKSFYSIKFFGRMKVF